MALAALACAAVGSASAGAQDLPPDVSEAWGAGPARALPDAPDDYARDQLGDVIWEYPRQASSVVEELQETYREGWPRVVAELGGDIPSQVLIRIGRNPSEMAALAPVEAPPPAYASGVAYPGRGLILLTLTAPETNETPDVPRVLLHELSHIALHRAVRADADEDAAAPDEGRAIPRWFSEGVAIYQARELNLERTRALWGGTVGGRLMGLDDLAERFPSRPHQVDLAYAQSADFVRWLREREDGEAKFREVIDRLRRGQSFETALSRTYSTNLTRLEIDWHADLGERFQALPLLVGSGGLWVLAAFLIVIAYVRRRRKDRAQFEAWEREEAIARASAQAVLATSATKNEGSMGPSPSEPDDDLDVLYVIPPEPRARDPQIPTVEHEGRSHTLH